MQENIINLIKKSRGTVDYKISHYPDGQTDIELGEINLKWPVRIICRIRNAEELFMLRMVSSVLKDMHATLKIVDIMYLMAARTDRKFSYNRPCTLDLVLNDLGSLGAEVIRVYEPHNYGALYHYMCNNPGTGFDCSESTPDQELGSYPDLFEELKTYTVGTEYNIVPDDTILVAPDEGAADRMREENTRYLGFKIITCKKVRDPETGKIQSVDIKEDISDIDFSEKILLVVDDLSDGGGTFLSIAPKLRELSPKKLGLCIYHNIQEEGLKKLARTYDFVATTDSYKDWNNIVEEDPESYPNVLVCKLRYRPYTKE